MKVTFIICFIFFSILIQGCDDSGADRNKIVIFDVEELNIPHNQQQTKQQSVTLFGCNDTRKEKKDLIWGEESSMLLPYGWHNDDGKNFFVAQYYVASPPVPAKPKKGKKTTLGLLYKDNFRFETQEPSETIKLDYNVLKPMYLSYLNVDFGSCKGKVDYIPIRTSCPEYPSVNGNTKPASGIGVIENIQDHGKIFIPTMDEGGVNPLQCHASILNDIQLHYKIGFSINDVITDNINLTQQLIEQLHPTDTRHSDQIITLICDERPESAPLPSGCKF